MRESDVKTRNRTKTKLYTIIVYFVLFYSCFSYRLLFSAAAVFVVVIVIVVDIYGLIGLAYHSAHWNFFLFLVDCFFFSLVFSVLLALSLPAFDSATLQKNVSSIHIQYSICHYHIWSFYCFQFEYVSWLWSLNHRRHMTNTFIYLRINVDWI